MENEASSSLSWVLPNLMAGLAILISIFALWRSSKGDQQQRQRDISQKISDCILAMQTTELSLANSKRKVQDQLAKPGQSESGRLQSMLVSMNFMIDKLQELRTKYNDAFELKSSSHKTLLLMDTLLTRLHQDMNEARELDKQIDMAILEVSKILNSSHES